MMNRKRMTGVSGICLLLIAGGCAPTGDSGGRVPVSEMTKGERRSDQMRTADLAEASDEVVMNLAADLSRLADEDFRGYRITVMLGDIVNKSGTMSTTDFEYVRNRIKSKLMQSDMVRDNIKFVEKRARIENLNRQEYGDQKEDILQEGKGGGVGVERTDPHYAFYLNGETYGVHRGETHLFSVTFELQRASDGEIVFNKHYEVKYH